MNSNLAALLRLDFAIFAATVSTIVGLQQYYQHYKNHSDPSRRARTCRHVSFSESVDDDNTNESTTSPTILVSLSLMEEVRKTSHIHSSSRPILGLLFAAAWCPDCRPVVPAISKIVEQQQQYSSNLIDVVYVSSDTNQDEMLAFKPKSLYHIPFGDLEQRSALKRSFHTCAAKEVDPLQIVRRNGIPTLILLDTASGRVISESGVTDVVHCVSISDTLKKWNALLEGKGR